MHATSGNVWQSESRIQQNSITTGYSALQYILQGRYIPTGAIDQTDLLLSDRQTHDYYGAVKEINTSV